MTVAGGLALQTADTFSDFIEHKTIAHGGNDAEVYFEENEFDKSAAFLEKMKSIMPDRSKNTPQASGKYVSMILTCI